MSGCASDTYGNRNEEMQLKWTATLAIKLFLKRSGSVLDNLSELVNDANKSSSKLYHMKLEDIIYRRTSL